jgi:hypothetical protein
VACSGLALQQILGDPKVTTGGRDRHARSGRTQVDTVKVHHTNEIVFHEGAPHDVGTCGGGSDLAELGQQGTEGRGANGPDPSAGQRIREEILSGPQRMHTAQRVFLGERSADGRESTTERRKRLPAYPLN